MTLEERIRAQVQAIEGESFSAAIGALVRAVDVWEAGEKMPPAWALEARDSVVAFFESWSELQSGAEGPGR